MRELKNKEGKRFLIFYFIIIAIACLVTGLMLKGQEQKSQAIVNETIAKIISKIQESYPEVKEEELIQILNETGNVEQGKEILKRYGIEDVSAIQKLEDLERERRIYLISIVGILGITCLIVFFFYLKYRQKKINELVAYMKKIEQKEYSLDIEEYSEDELNQLKSELYKITVMLKEQAEESTRQKESLATAMSDISHQLKTPLTSIQILLDNLRESENMDPETRKKFLMEVSSQIKGMNWLVISFLKLSKLDAGSVSFKKEKIQLKELIQDVLANLEILAELKDISISFEGEDEIEIWGDYHWNKEAILNIVKNAIEHTPNGKRIWIQLEDNSAYTKISIQDEGEGMSKEDQKHIFDRFYKAENASEESIGIGLALSKSIIENQNGYITVESEKGKGTTFSIRYIK